MLRHNRQISAEYKVATRALHVRCSRRSKAYRANRVALIPLRGRCAREFPRTEAGRAFRRAKMSCPRRRRRAPADRSQACCTREKKTYGEFEAECLLHRQFRSRIRTLRDGPG